MSRLIHGAAWEDRSEMAGIHMREVFEAGGTVEFYRTFFTDVFPSEVALLSDVVCSGCRVLDLGVGAGRTTRWLSDRAGRYVGVDYSESMIAACRERFPAKLFPDVSFEVADVSDLSVFADGSFDVAVFSLNGIDCLYPDASRRRFIGECRRVLSPTGSLVLSVHNPRAFLVCPGPGFADLTFWERLVGRCRCAVDTLIWWPGVIRRRSFWTGEGYYWDSRAHGGMWLHAATPDKVVAEFDAAGFRLVGRPVDNEHPGRTNRPANVWYYYRFDKIEQIDRSDGS